MIQLTIKKIVNNAIKKTFPNFNQNFDISNIKDVKLGDFSTNVGMIIAKLEHRNPIDISNEIKNNIDSNIFTEITVIKPGFINFVLKPEIRTSLLHEILEKKSTYGCFPSKNFRISVEYVSANPTGYIHIGHARNAVLGSAIISILKAYGYQTVSEYIVNNAGNQMNNLASAVLIRYLQIFKIDIELPADSYHGDEIVLVAKELKEKFGDRFIDCEIIDGQISDQKIKSEIKWFAEERLLQQIKDDLKVLGVVIKKYTSEYSFHENKEIYKLLDSLLDSGRAYKKDGAVWLKTTDYGDDKDRVLLKSDGAPTYFLPDIVYHNIKYTTNNTDMVINIWGADHYSYITRMTAAIQILGYKKENFKVICMQMVHLVKDGKEYKMSKRSGQSLTTKDLVKAIGKDAARWYLISQSANNHIEIDVDVATTKDNKNPIYYVQYALVRAHSLLIKQQVENPHSFNLLTTNIERELINMLINFPLLIQTCATSYEPYKITVYLSKLAKLFHNYYANNKILVDNNPKLAQQYYLIKVIHQIISNGLDLLGISRPEKM